MPKGNETNGVLRWVCVCESAYVCPGTTLTSAILVKWPYISVSEWDETAWVTKVDLNALTRKTSRQHRPGHTEARGGTQEGNGDKDQRRFLVEDRNHLLTQTVQHMVQINPEAH